MGEHTASCSSWSASTIWDISEKVAMGPFGSSLKVATFVPSGVPIINGQHLLGARVEDSQGHNFITDDHAQRLSNANVQRGGIESGFCKPATLEEIGEHGHVLTPGRYVGAAPAEDDGVPFEQRFTELKETLAEQFAEADRLSSLIQKKLEEVGSHA